MKEEEILCFLGLAARAGKVESGFDAVCSALRRGDVKLLIISRDISRNSLSKLLDCAKNYDVPATYSFAKSDDIGYSIGKNKRAIVAVTDVNFASRLIKMLDDFDYKEE